MNDQQFVSSKEKRNNNQGGKMTTQKKETKTAETYRTALAPQAPKSAFRGRIERLGLTLLAFALVIGVTGSAIASQSQDEAGVRARRQLCQGFRSEESRTAIIAIRRKRNLRDARW
jgi:hypothetical protein